MSHKRNDESSPLEGELAKFTVVGESSDLPRSFFDALARLLLDAHDREKREARNVAKEDSRPLPPVS